MEIIFHPEVKEDIEELNGSVRKRFKKTLKKIKRAPRLGKPLGNKGEIDLSSCLKMYFNAYKRILKEGREE